MTRKYGLIPDDPDERDLPMKFTLNVNPKVKLPRSIDLRPTMPPVYDQGAQGSCTANAGCTYRHVMLKKPEIDFSREYLYRKERELEGTVEQDAGAQMRTIGKALQKYGVCEEKYMPYCAENLFAIPTPEAETNASKYKIRTYQRLYSLDEIKNYLALRQMPVLIGMKVFDYMESPQMAKTGVLQMPKSNERFLGGHAVLVVGYIDNTVSTVFSRFTNVPVKGNLIVRNSWGKNWGKNGYFFMPYDYVTKGHAFDFWVLED